MDTTCAALDGSIQAHDLSKTLANFSPGPAPLPIDVLAEVRRDLLNWNGTGTSVLCLTHRSPQFGSILREAVQSIRKLLIVPQSFEIIFTHGGGHGQFSSVPLNLCPEGKENVAEYVVTGTWSERAAKEAEKYVTVKRVEGVCESSNSSVVMPSRAWKTGAKASYRYLCSNETVGGIEFHSIPRFKDDVPLVIDCSSDIASKKIEWDRVGVIFACAPKNIGHAGLTVTIVRRDLLSRKAQPITPCIMVWRNIVDSGGMYNTPPTFNIYTTMLVARWMSKQGGISEMKRRAEAKARAIYDAIDESDGFYSTPVSGPHRSNMNVPFIVKDGKLNDAFLRAAYAKNMVGFRTKTPFGIGKWLRASFYTGTTVAQAEALAIFMRAFAKQNGN